VANELYLYGSNSGWICSQASPPSPGTSANRSCHLANAAAGLTLICSREDELKPVDPRDFQETAGGQEATEAEEENRNHADSDTIEID